MKMDKLIGILDKVASEIQERGLTALATEIDVVANTLERMAYTRGEQIDPSQVDRPTDRLVYLLQMLTLLGETRLGNNPIVIKLKRLVAVEKNRAIESGDMTPILGSTESKSYLQWLHSLAAKAGKEIPNDFFYRNGNVHQATFDDLAAVLHILDERITPVRGPSRKPEDLQQFTEKELAVMNSPVEGKKDWGKLDELFKKAGENVSPEDLEKLAAGAVLPGKFRDIEAIIRSLARAQ